VLVVEGRQRSGRSRRVQAVGRKSFREDDAPPGAIDDRACTPPDGSSSGGRDLNQGRSWPLKEMSWRLSRSTGGRRSTKLEWLKMSWEGEIFGRWIYQQAISRAAAAHERVDDVLTGARVTPRRRVVRAAPVYDWLQSERPRRELADAQGGPTAFAPSWKRASTYGAGPAPGNSGVISVLCVHAMGRRDSWRCTARAHGDVLGVAVGDAPERPATSKGARDAHLTSWVTDVGRLRPIARVIDGHSSVSR
jgi:hypothetical protein